MDKLDIFFEEIFSIFGFGVSQRSSRFFATLVWILNMTFTLTIIIVYVADGNLFVSYDALSKITDIVQLFGPIFVHLAVISLNLVNYKDFKLILEKKDFLDDLLKSYEKDEVFKKIQRKRNFIFFVKAITMIVVGNGIEIFVLKTLERSDPDWMRSIRARVFSLIMTRWLGLQFIFFCDYLSSRFEFFNLINPDVFQTEFESEMEVESKLKKLKVIDLEFVKLIQMLREYFKWMLLFSITQDIFDITIDVYWIYGGLTFGNNPNFLQSCLCPVSKILGLLLLFYSTDNTQKHRDNLLTEVFKWKIDDNRISNGKRRFLLQTFHTSKFMFDANGFFFINYSSLIGIIEAITIYMVYLFQFMSQTNIFTLAIEREKELKGEETKLLNDKIE